MSNTDYYYFRGMLNELKTHSTHLTSHSTDLDQIESACNQVKDNTDLIEGRLYDSGTNQNVAEAVATGNSTLTAMNVNLNDIESACNQVKDNTQFVNSRLNNIQNKLAENSDGSGDTAGQLLKSLDTNVGDCESALNDINPNMSLTASRLNNIQNKLAENSDGSGDTAGELLVTVNTKLDLNNSRGDELYMDTHVSMISNGSIGAGAFSVVIDMVASTGYQYRTITIYGSTTSATGKLHFSGSDASGGTYYINPTSAALQVDNAGSDYHFIMSWENCPFRYVKVYASAVSSGLYLNHIKTKHR